MFVCRRVCGCGWVCAFSTRVGSNHRASVIRRVRAQCASPVPRCQHSQCSPRFCCLTSAYEDILDQFYTMIMPISTRKACTCDAVGDLECVSRCTPSDMTTPGNHEWPCFFGSWHGSLCPSRCYCGNVECTLLRHQVNTRIACSCPTSKVEAPRRCTTGRW